MSKAMVLVFAIAVSPAVLAVEGVVDGCGCYCGKMVPSPCTEQDCINACGDGGDPEHRGSSDGDLLGQRQELIRQQQQAEKRRLDRKRQQEADDRRRKEEFDNKKIETLKSIKGLSSPGGGGIKDLNTNGGNNTPAFGLKGVDAKDAGLKNVAAPGRYSSQGAWRQLQCGEYIMQAGVAKARALNTKADLQEAQYLTDQALRALNGGQLEVECGPADVAPKVKGSPPPDFREHYSDTLKLLRVQTEILWRAKQQLKDAQKKGNAAEIQQAEKDVQIARNLLSKMGQANDLVMKDPAKADQLFLQIMEEADAAKKRR